MNHHLKSDIITRFAFVDGHSDLWRLFYDGDLFHRIIAELARPYETAGITKVAGIEARGFILGAAVAAHMKVGFVAIRKPGSLYPGPKIERTTSADYRGKQHALRLQKAAVQPGDNILLVDDWFETGNQALTAKAMIEACGGHLAGCSIIVDQLSVDMRARLGAVSSLVSAAELNET